MIEFINIFLPFSSRWSNLFCMASDLNRTGTLWSTLGEFSEGIGASLFSRYLGHDDPHGDSPQVYFFSLGSSFPKGHCTVLLLVLCDFGPCDVLHGQSRLWMTFMSIMQDSNCYSMKIWWRVFIYLFIIVCFVWFVWRARLPVTLGEASSKFPKML